MDVICVILAGGKSSRFGQDKAFLELGGKRIVETIAEGCHSISDEILIVSNAQNKFGISGTREISDQIPNAGPLGGIHAAMMEAAGKTLFITACDLPFFEPKLARLLLKRSKDYDAFLPCVGEWVEPLFAVYHSSILPHVEELLRADRHSVRELCSSVRTGYFDCKDWCTFNKNGIESPFYNINFPEDFSALSPSLKNGQ